MALPENINYTTVTGRFIRAVADTADVGKEPDAVPAVGLSIVFTPSVDVVTDDAATPPVTIVIDPITCTTDTQGYLLGPDGTPGVMLISSADEDLRPHHWTYTATVTGTNYRRVTSTFITEPGATVDLSTVVQVPASPGAAITQWQAAVVATEAARDVVLAAVEDLPTGGGLPADATLEDLAESSTVKYFTDAEKVKLAGVASGATVNDTDANLRARANHTGSQAIATVTGLQSALDAKAPTVHTHTTANVTGLDTTLAGKAPLASPAFTGTPTGITKTHVGLGNVDNTSDASKPISTATQAALNSKIGSPNATVTGFEYYPTVEDLPTPGVAGVIYLVDLV